MAATTGRGSLDQLGRPLGSLRLSVTDRCNMRCGYCMPDEDYVWLPRESILRFEELDRLADLFLRLGVRKIRLTGGEPLLRHGLPQLVALLRQRPDLEDLALTTNGLLLEEQAPALAAAGLDRVTVSLDTLKADRLQAFARTPRHGDIIAGIDAARRAGLQGTKLNAVIIRGFNDDELPDLLEFARDRQVEVRFIEYMDVGGATRWAPADVISQEEMLARLETRYGSIEPLATSQVSAAPAERFRLRDGTEFGIIASTTTPFCRSCDRSRITADGTWFLCLYADHGVDLRDPLRSGWPDETVLDLIRRTWGQRMDRGAEERLAVEHRGVLYQIAGLRADPRREMHTRGG